MTGQSPQSLHRLQNFRIEESPTSVGDFRTLSFADAAGQEFSCVVDRQMLAGLGQLISKHLAQMSE